VPETLRGGQEQFLLAQKLHAPILKAITKVFDYGKGNFLKANLEIRLKHALYCEENKNFAEGMTFR
jgi:hypothetical protein